MDECASNPCDNESLCDDVIDGYICICKVGFTGSNCEDEIDECSSSPCHNYARCIDILAGYVCQCNPGFTGIDI